MNRINYLRLMVEGMENGTICCICGMPIEGWGNNPDPVVREPRARCCDECNQRYVLPARIVELYRREKTNDEVVEQTGDSR